MKPIEFQATLTKSCADNFISTPHQKTVLNELDKWGQETEYSAKRLESKIPTSQTIMKCQREEKYNHKLGIRMQFLTNPSITNFYIKKQVEEN